MIVATAGHVDHGKTALVRALTGVDTDRLPEEKKRGLTIDLGFAHCELAGGHPVSFIDVPGHKRFIHNMLAGVAGVDLAVLVVAADDGIMPQTREHLAILDLVGVRDGLVALTKTDRADESRCAEVMAAIAALLADTGLAGAEIVPVSTVTGEGLAAFRASLERCAAGFVRRAATGGFRLAVDRVFTMSGTGIIVTGTVFSGSVAAGDELVLSPAGVALRVRGLQSRETAAHSASAGDRCALNVAGNGLTLDLIHRGDWIQTPALQRPTSRLDARLQILPSEAAGFAHWTSVHVHMGAARRTARVALLDHKVIPPGESALVQLVLDEPVCATVGDRFIVRDQTAQRTRGGGAIVYPYSPARGRARPARIAELTAMENRAAREALQAWVAVPAAMVPLGEFLCAFNLGDEEAAHLLAATEVCIAGTGSGRLAMSPETWNTLRLALEEAVDRYHETHPNELGPTASALSRALADRVKPTVFDAVVGALIAGGTIVKTGTIVHRPERRAAPSPEDDRLWHAVYPIMNKGGLKPPIVRDLAAAINLPHTEVDKALNRMVRFGRVMKVAPNRYFPTEAVAALGEMAAELAERSGAEGFTAKAFRDRSGIGRNLTIEVLEFFDRLGLTRRIGDRRRLLRPIAELIAVSSGATD